MDHCDFNYADALFSICNDNEDVTPNIEEMLTTTNDDNKSQYQCRSIETITRKDDILSSSPGESDNLSSLQDEFESLAAYSSQPQTPCDSFISSNDYANPLSQIGYSSSYSDDIADDSNESVNPTFFKRNNYDTSSLMYSNDDMTTFSGIVNCNDVLKTSKSNETSTSNTIVCCYRNTPEVETTVSSSSPIPTKEITTEEQSQEGK